MQTQTAIRLIDEMVYKPGWRFECTEGTDRFEGAVRMAVHYPALELGRSEAEHGYGLERADTIANFMLMVAACDNEVALYRIVAEKIMLIEEHEMREALRVRPTFWAPFHPHRQDGMERWGNPMGDLFFGMA